MEILSPLCGAFQSVASALYHFYCEGHPIWFLKVIDDLRQLENVEKGGS